ncbi:MAG: chromate transporter [Treponema sp.]|jgi:chromate transporter|nr:chromate transporter [Treponema sp.]
MIYLLIFVEFFKIGLFSIGGGLATIPFLFQLAGKYPWVSPETITTIQAIAQSAPGAIGINMAAGTGFYAAGFMGAILAILGEIAPSVVIISLVARTLNAFKKNADIQAVFSGMRPAATGLLASAGFGVIKLSLWNGAVPAWFDMLRWKECLLFTGLFAFIRVFKLHPFVYIAIAGVVGVLWEL